MIRNLVEMCQWVVDRDDCKKPNTSSLISNLSTLAGPFGESVWPYSTSCQSPMAETCDWNL